MADGKKGQKSGNTSDDTLRAGVDREEEREVRAEARETADEKVIPQHEAELEARDEEDPTLLKELPEDGAVATVQEELAATAAAATAPYGRPIEDEFTGRGGTYVIDAKTGLRKRQYEAVRDRKNPEKIRGYRPAV